jgi:hypothetical protein
MNNCPSCKRVPPSLELSHITGRDEILPSFSCTTLSCSLCGAIVMAIPDLGHNGVLGADSEAEDLGAEWKEPRSSLWTVAASPMARRPMKDLRNAPPGQAPRRGSWSDFAELL